MSAPPENEAQTPTPLPESVNVIGPPPAASRWCAGVCGCVLAALLTGAVLALRLALAGWFGERRALILFVLPIFLCAHLGGLWPGLAATAVAAVGTKYFLLSPTHSWHMVNPVDETQWLLLLGFGVLCSGLLQQAPEREREGIASVATRPRKVSTERKMQAGFVLALLCLMAIAIVCSIAMARQREWAAGTARAQEVLFSLQQVSATAAEAETAGRGFVITGEEYFLESYGQARRKSAATFQRLQELTAADGVQQQATAALEPLLTECLAETQRSLDLRQQQGFAAAQSALSGEPGRRLHERLRVLVGEMEATEQRRLSAQESRTRRWAGWTQLAITGGSGMAFSFVAVALWVLGREFASARRAEEALREAHVRLAASVDAEREKLIRMIEHSRDFIATADLDGRLTFINAGGRKMIGLREGQDPGAIHFTDYIPGEWQKFFTETVIPTAREEGLWEGEMQLIHLQTGVRVEVFRSTFLLRDAAGQPNCFATVTRDITEAKQAEAALLALHEKELLLHDADRRLAEIVNGMTEACFALDAEWRFTFVNDRSETLLQRRREEMLGRTLWEVFDRLLGTPMEANYRRAMMERVPVAFEVFSPIAERWLDIRLFPTADGLAAFLLDIQGRKTVEEALERSRAEFMDLFDNAPAGYHEVDAEGRIARINQTELKMLGYAAEDLLGEFVWKLSAEEETSRRAVGEKLRGNLPTKAFERRLKRKDGSSFPVLIEDRLVRAADGAIVGLRSVIKDITERKQLELTLRENEERFRTMANSIPQLAWIAGADGTISWFNERWFAYTGTTPAQMEDEGWKIVHDPAMLPLVLKNWAATLASGQPLEMEFPLRGADGRFRSFLTRVQPLRGEEGQVVQWFGTNTDVETLKQAEHQVRASERKLREVIDGLGPNTFLGLMTAGGILIEANRPGLVAAGVRAEDVLGRPFDQTVWWRHSEPVRAQVRAAMARGAAGEASRFDVQVCVAGDALVWIDFSLTPVRDAEGVVVYLVPSGIVVDERVQAEAAIQQLNAELEGRVLERTAQLEAANKELEAFSYSVSHDLRAPLRAVDGFSRVVQEDYGPLLPEEGQRFLHTIRQSAQRMGVLIDDLLTFSRLNRLPLRKRLVDNRAVVDECLAELQSEHAGRTLEVKIGEIPVSSGDSALLKQVWLNLISNACKYTQRREVALVEIGSSPGPGETIFFVRDNGAGFDMRYADKLFGVFQRLHRAEDYEGTGVGLAIVQRIVQRHGGRVWAEAQEDRGATFYFTLPLEDAL